MVLGDSTILPEDARDLLKRAAKIGPFAIDHAYQVIMDKYPAYFNQEEEPCDSITSASTSAGRE